MNVDLSDYAGGDFNQVQNITNLVINIFNRDINAMMSVEH